MIKVQTILKVVDNTGAVFVMCIKILNISKKLGVLPGHETKCTVKKKRHKKKVFKKFKEIKKGALYNCLLVRNVRSLKR
jgi:large subunit ribosomal protein L14